MLLQSLPTNLDHIIYILMYDEDKLDFDNVYFALLLEDIKKLANSSKLVNFLYSHNS